MNVRVYVEGPADRAVLGALFGAWRDRHGARLSFHDLGGKDKLLDEIAGRARAVLDAEPASHVFALPDLYPYRQYARTDRAHASAPELRRLLRSRVPHGRFHPHCLVHDLEALLLAAPEALAAALGQRSLKTTWALPVETQDHDRPPKVVVNELFRRHRQRGYLDTLDGPRVLRGAGPDELAAGCPEGFGTFARDLAATLGIDLAPG